jgi:hypothetical protein
LAGIVITDHEYPVRPAFSLISKVLDDFTAAVPQTALSNPSAISFPKIDTYLQQYQDPRQVDTIMRVQQELDETKIILVRNFEGLRRVDSQEVYSTRRSNPCYSGEKGWTT